MPLNLQGKVLRAIETKTVQRIGSTHTIPVDFRLITATNEDLAQLVEAKQFRADLYYRLNVIPIRLAAPAGAAGGHCSIGQLFSGSLLSKILQG